MAENLIKQLEKEGKLRKQKAGLVQVEALLREAILDLQEAKKICAIAERATYVLAYIAMLKAGRALLLAKGYVPDDGGQHKTVIEVTANLLGTKFRDITAQFERMRRKRNEITYEAGYALSVSESLRAFNDSIELVKKIIDYIKADNPQLEIDFNLKSK